MSNEPDILGQRQLNVKLMNNSLDLKKKKEKKKGVTKATFQAKCSTIT